MQTNYKFSYIRRDDNGFITKAEIRYHEGEVTTKDQADRRGDLHSVTRYRMTKLLRIEVYTTKDFGRIKDDDELRAFLNVELKKDSTRTPIESQTETDLAKIRKLIIK